MPSEGLEFPRPTPSDLGDHEVPRDGDALDGVRVALVVTGGIAAMKAPMVARALRRQGATVTAFATTEALRYVGRDALAWACDRPVVVELSADAEHLSDAAPFDAYLVAPATYSVIGKCAHGIADTPVTSALASGIGRMERGRATVLFAPTMHGSMHTSILEGNLRALAAIGCTVIPPRDAYGKHNLPDEAELVRAVVDAVSTRRAPGLRQAVSPRPQ